MNTKKIVVGVDASTGSRAALAWAIDYARATESEVLAIHCAQIPIPPMVVASVFLTDAEVKAFWDQTKERVSNEFCEQLHGSGVHFQIFTSEARPASGILTLAESVDASLVVVGNGHHSAVAEIFVGSVAHELAQHSMRPVVVVPAPVRTVKLVKSEVTAQPEKGAVGAR